MNLYWSSLWDGISIRSTFFGTFCVFRRCHIRLNKWQSSPIEFFRQAQLVNVCHVKSEIFRLWVLLIVILFNWINQFVCFSNTHIVQFLQMLRMCWFSIRYLRKQFKKYKSSVCISLHFQINLQTIATLCHEWWLCRGIWLACVICLSPFLTFRQMYLNYQIAQPSRRNIHNYHIM